MLFGTEIMPDVCKTTSWENKEQWKYSGGSHKQGAEECPLGSKPTLAMTWTCAPLFTAPHNITGAELSILALFCVKRLPTLSCVCFPPVSLSEVCVIAARRVLPKQRLAVRRGGNLPLSNSTTPSNQAWISPLFMTPDTHFNLITQLPAFLSPLDLSHDLSFSHSPLISISLDPPLPLSCLPPYSSFIPWQWHCPRPSSPLNHQCAS